MTSDFRIYAWRAFREAHVLYAKCEGQRILARAANHIEGMQWARPETPTFDALRLLHDASRRLDVEMKLLVDDIWTKPWQEARRRGEK